MIQSLRLRDQFEEALNNYQVSQPALSVLKETSFVLMAGLTSSGRNTIIEHLVETGAYAFVKSDTTRTPRIAHGVLEQNGGPYWFKTEEEVLADLKDGRYIEAAIIHNQQVSGISVAEVEKAKTNQQIAITEVTTLGVKTLSKLKPDIICVFVLPPSYEAWIERLKRRSDMPGDELKRRVASALEEISDLVANPDYRIVVNTNLDETIEKVRSIVEKNQYSQEEHKQGLKVAQDIKAAIDELASEN